LISHEYKCIFIHIPATAGSSIEDWIIGKDWWSVSPSTKHIFASQAKRLYADFWDDYFKFTIVRDPVDRMRSCLRFPEISFLKVNQDGDIDFSRYLDVYARGEVILEYDWRFYERAEVELLKHIPNALYSNILDEELDYIGRFEDLGTVVETLRERLGIGKKFESHLQASSPGISSIAVSDATRRLIQSLFWRDYERFNFQFNVPSESQADEMKFTPHLFNEGDLSVSSENSLLQSRIRELLLYRDGYRAFVHEMNEKNDVISLLQNTVQSLIVDRDNYKDAYLSEKSKKKRKWF
jgi:hypothetical protein